MIIFGESKVTIFDQICAQVSELLQKILENNCERTNQLNEISLFFQELDIEIEKADYSSSSFKFTFKEIDIKFGILLFFEEYDRKKDWKSGRLWHLYQFRKLKDEIRICYDVSLNKLVRHDQKDFNKSLSDYIECVNLKDLKRIKRDLK